MTKFNPGQAVLVDSQISGEPPVHGTIVSDGGADSVMVEFEHGGELWCDRSEVRPR